MHFFSRKVRPCPGDPGDYSLVKRGDKYYWRLRRGSIKPATLNAALRYRSDVMRQTSPFIKKLKNLLHPYLGYLQVGDLHQRLYKAAEKQVAETRGTGFDAFKYFDMQPNHPLERLLLTTYMVREEAGAVKIEFGAHEHPVQKFNSEITDFVFETITVIGKGEEMRTEAQSFPIFHINQAFLKPFVIEIGVPVGEPWMIILKVSCFEGREWARSGRHYGMKVVAVRSV